MATNFPTALDGLRANQGLTDGVSIVTVAPHNNLMDAVDALQTKVGINSSGVVTTLDYKVAHKGALASGSTVFNTHLTTANTWQNLDLSAIVGAKAALVFLDVYFGAALGFRVKPTGSAGLSTAHLGFGCSGITSTLADRRAFAASFTDASGIIAIAGDNNTTVITILVVGYVG